MSPVVIVLNGTSSAGKTSIARVIQRLSGIPTLHASLDTFVDMFHWPAIGNQDEQSECHAIGVANFHAALPMLTANRFLVVVDHVFARESWYQDCRDALKDRTTYYVGVRCPLATLEKREQARGDRKIGLAASQIGHVHEGKTYALEVDTSLHTAEECAIAILAFINNAPPKNRKPA